jgi:threonylcarbamoyladenosine tRNA methylthiotransferase MtaB
MFQNSLAIIEECDLAMLHVFPFSPRAGTPAARMPQVPRDLVKARAARLRAAGDKALARRFAMEIGSTRSALVERPGLGRTEHFLPVTLDRGEPGEVVPVLVRGAGERALLGEATRKAA